MAGIFKKAFGNPTYANQTNIIRQIKKKLGEGHGPPRPPLRIDTGGSLFTSDERWSEDFDARIGKAEAVLHELGRSMVTKR